MDAGYSTNTAVRPSVFQSLLYRRGDASPVRASVRHQSESRSGCEFGIGVMVSYGRYTTRSRGAMTEFAAKSNEIGVAYRSLEDWWTTRALRNYRSFSTDSDG